MDAYQMATDRICAMLEQGFIPWQRPWAMAKTVAWSGNDGHTYTLLNQFLLADPDKKYADWSELAADIAGEWITFNECQKRGGRVKAKEHGRKVVYFTMIDVEDEDSEGNKKTKKIPYLKASVVFKISQCEGITQKFHTDADELYDFTGDKTADEVAEDYVTREGITVKYVHGNRAFYSPATDSVTLPLREQFKDSGEFYSTYFHELTHSTGHEKRLNRIKQNAAFGDEEYSTEELVAEIGSCSILATLGIESENTFRNSTAYIQNWLKALKSDKKMIVTASSRAEKAIRLILDIKEDKKSA